MAVLIEKEQEHAESWFERQEAGSWRQKGGHFNWPPASLLTNIDMQTSAEVIEIRYDEAVDTRKVTVRFNWREDSLRWRYMLEKALEAFDRGDEDVELILDERMD